MNKMLRINSCNLCGAKKFEFLYKTKDRMFNLDGTFNLKKCSNCSLVFLDPQPGQIELKKHYPSRKYYAYNKTNKKGLLAKLREYPVRHYYSPSVLSFIITTFIKNVPAIPSYKKNGKILDLGCGTGETLLLLKKIGWKTYGMDIDRNALSVAKKSGLNNLSLGGYRDLKKYPDNYFDAIRLYHVIEHIDNPSLAISLIKRKLKKNGEVIMGTPDINSIVAKLFKSYWYNLDSPRHLYLFSTFTLKKMIEKEGLRIEKIRFESGWGIAGSLQYFINDKFNKKLNLINNFFVFLAFYPLEWLLDKLQLGDIFITKAKK
jgi:2-polyprenyl-3-methyl-5-hydroxy-6-metoxy-1,4-benzoquinol methylase